MAAHAGGKGSPSASVGNEREHFVKMFLQEVFPPVYRFGSGFTTDADGNQSGQLDVAIEMPFAPNFPMPGGRERLYLAESLLAVIEVKSDLAKQWDEVIATAAKLRPVRRRLTNVLSVGPANGNSEQIPLIAVGYVGYKSAAKLAERLANTPEDRRPDAVFVIESGAVVLGGFQGEGPAGLFAIVAGLIALTQQNLAKTAALSEYLR